MAQMENAFTGQGQEGLGILPEFLSEIKDDLLKIPPIFKVPIELSMLIFIAINIYKSTYVAYNLNRSMQRLFTGVTIVALIIEISEVSHPSQLWAKIAVCIAAPIPMTYDRFVAAAFTSVFICFSQPLAFVLDLFFILSSCLRRERRISTAFLATNLGYVSACCLFSVLLQKQLSASGFTQTTVCFMIFYVLMTAFFMWFKEDSQWSQPLFLQIELVAYLIFPMVVDGICFFKYGGKKLTYSFPLKSHL